MKQLQGDIMLSNVRNSIWIYLTDGINFLGDLDILITFRHIGMINNYLCFLRNSNKFRIFVGILD